MLLSYLSKKEKKIKTDTNKFLVVKKEDNIFVVVVKYTSFVYV